MSGQHNKIKHAYIIYVDKQHSIEYAKECADTCNRYGLPHTLWRGVQQFDREFLEAETGFKWTYQSNSGDCGCTASHLKLWRVIAEQEHACVVFEHDAILKYPLHNVEIPDDALVMLGYRVHSKDDYEHPGDPLSMVEIAKFEGTHAYAITPNMAKHMLKRMDETSPVNTTIDGILSIHNQLGLKRYIMDPPPAVCVVGDRISTIQARPADYNATPSPGFLKGLKVPPLRVMT